MKKNKTKLKEFESLIRPLRSKLFAIALKMSKNLMDAEDLMQDSYMKAWKHFHRFEHGTNFYAWMRCILTNHFINQYQKKKNQPFLNDFEYTCQRYSANDVREIVFNESNVMHEDYHYLFDDFITAALDKLPEHYRKTVLLSDTKELRYKEIAELLNCPIGTVMSRLNRGRLMLAKNLSSYAVVNGYISKPD